MDRILNHVDGALPCIVLILWLVHPLHGTARKLSNLMDRILSRRVTFQPVDGMILVI